MIKKDFYSQLFSRQIKKTDPDYIVIVKAELLFRIEKLQSENCNCFQCKSDLDKYRKYYLKLTKENEGR